MTRKSQRSPEHDRVETLRTITERRRSPRIQACIPVLLIWKENQQEHQEHASTLTISRFGCAALSQNFFRAGAHVQLKRNSRTIAAWVAYCLPYQSTKFFEVGLEFDHDGVEFWENPELGRMSR